MAFTPEKHRYIASTVELVRLIPYLSSHRESIDIGWLDWPPLSQALVAVRTFESIVTNL